MKKITFLIMLFISGAIYAQPANNVSTAPPARDAADVISIYGGDSNVYTNISGINYTPFWGQPNPYVVPNPGFDPGTGDLVLFYDDLTYQGTDFDGNRQNASSMEFIHVDVWTATGKTIKISPINIGGTGPGEVAVSITTTAGQWTSVDIPKASFTGMTWDSIAQLKIETEGQPDQREDVYLDNIYFWKNPTAAGSDATLADLKVDANTVAGFAPGNTNYTVDLPISATTAPQVTATATDANATISITQASSVPGSATVEVTSANSNVTETYTVTFRNVTPGPSPFPAFYTDHLALVQNVTDNTNFTFFWEPTYVFGQNPVPTPDLDESATVNKAFKMNLTVGHGGGIAQGGVDVVTDVSVNDTFHIDYFIPSSVEPGSLGHQFYIDLISRNTSNQNTESFYGVGVGQGGTPAFEVIDEQMVFDQWVGLDIPLSTFANRGFDVNRFFQYKIAASSDLRTKLGYFDNMYFYNQATASTGSVNNTDFRIFPNPASNAWNVVSSNGTIQSIELFSMLGNRVVSQKVNGNRSSIDNSSLAKGVYLAKISTSEGSTTIKLIKE